MIVKVLLPNAQDDVLMLELETNQPLSRLVSLVEDLLSLKPVSIYRDGQKMIEFSKTLEELNIRESDLLIVRVGDAQVPVPAPPPATSDAPADVDRYFRLAESIRQYLPPTLTQPVAPSPPDFQSVEGQQRLWEAIQAENINRNLAEAESFIPESFMPVTMLHVKLLVNGVMLQAFVDCGAQTSIMSRRVAEKCHLSHLIDRRYATTVRGVGQTQSVGRIHRAVMQCAGAEFDASFVVLEELPHDMLFGLDLLYRHQCTIDLKKRVLRIADLIEVEFLDESALKPPTTDSA